MAEYAGQTLHGLKFAPFETLVIPDWLTWDSETNHEHTDYWCHNGNDCKMLVELGVMDYLEWDRRKGIGRPCKRFTLDWMDGLTARYIYTDDWSQIHRVLVELCDRFGVE